jgi:beta-lactamase superfamily II metal-dependent hydrolase
MTIAMRIEALPARLGDCLLVECLREGTRPWRMLIDGGPSDTWPMLEERLRRLEDPTIDVAVITHIDDDHIAGFLKFLESDLATSVGDYWFNGLPQLPERPIDVDTRSFAQGDAVGAMLDATDRPLPWNEAFNGAAVVSGEDAPHMLAIHGGPTITVVSPSAKRLLALSRRWREALSEGTRGEDEHPVGEPPPLADLESLAAEKWPKDGSPANGASIGLLVEYRGASALLTGDAWGNVLAPELARLAQARRVDAVEVDAVKLPHHGSRANVLAGLTPLAPAAHYIVSSNGDRFGHPDDQALARVVTEAPRGATLWFTYDNARTRRWDDPALAAQYGYLTRFPQSEGVGVVVELEAR